MKQASMTKYILHTAYIVTVCILCWHHLTARLEMYAYIHVLHISCGATIKIDTTWFHHEQNSWNMEKIKDDRNRKIATHMKQLTDYLRKTPRWQVNPFFLVFLFPFPFFLCERVWTPYHCFGSGAETTRRSLGIFPAGEDLWYALGHRLDYDSALESLESLDLATETSQQVHDQESILRLDLELWSQFDTGTQDSVEYNSNLPTPRSLDTGLWW